MSLDLPPLPEPLGAAARALFGASTLPASANASLVWDRYPRVWMGSDVARNEQISQFLSAFARDFQGQRARGEPQLRAWLERVGAGAEARDFVTHEPLVTGLGAAHPTENGFSFDRLLGVPVLSGSGLKGLARAAAHLLGERDDVIVALLGSEAPAREGGDETAPGAVRVIGGWPTTWPRLRAELIAPHHPGYREEEALEAREAISQRGGRTGIPSYVEEPRPVSFLAVEPGARFRLFLASTGRAPADLDRVWDWLTLGLDLLGFGGKTASGFGRMLPPEGRQAPRAPTPGEPDEPIGPAMDGPRLLIAFEANLGGRSASVSEAEVRSAEPSITGPTVWWNRSGQALPNLQTGWPKVLSRLTGERDKLTRQVAGMTPRPSVTIAALGEIPALIALGWVIGDATPAEAILKRRGEPWGWAPDAPDDPPLELRRPADPAGSIALVLSLSGRVDTSALPPAPDGAWAIWEIAPPEPSLGAIRSRGQRDRLLRLVREAVGAARPRSGAPVHVFPAIPAAIAVELGLAWSPRAWPPMWIYDAGPRWTGPYKLER